MFFSKEEGKNLVHCVQLSSTRRSVAVSWFDTCVEDGTHSG